MLFVRTNLSINGFDLLQRGQHEHGRLAHTRFGLAQDVHAQDGLWDAFMLDWSKKQTHTEELDDCIHVIFKLLFKAPRHVAAVLVW